MIVSFIFALFTTHSTRYKNNRKWTYIQDDALFCLLLHEDLVDDDDDSKIEVLMHESTSRTF